jgi:lipopolysaccharide/colanic/teichoic acid biosynthesis glycosyltransferase
MIGLIDKIIILIAFPILIIFGVLIVVLKVIFDGLPIFYLSVRYSSFEKYFVSIKFKSMVNNADLIKNEIQKFDEGGFQTIPLSAKIYTRFGRILEKTQLVELPQLINCLKGDLFLVGARPLPKHILMELSQKFGSENILKRGLRKGGLTRTAKIMGKFNLIPINRLKIETAEAQFFLDAYWKSQIFVHFFILIETLFFVSTGSAPKKFIGFILKKLDPYMHQPLSV